MTHTVYGLRIKGDREVRYIGITGNDVQLRLHIHLMRARGKSREQRTLAQWLVENDGNVEIFPIAKVETKEEAVGHEKAIIALCLRLNQRLLNQRGLPPEHYPQWGKKAVEQVA